MKKEEYEIFIDEMSNLGDEWTIEELEGTSYSKMSYDRRTSHGSLCSCL